MRRIFGRNRLLNQVVIAALLCSFFCSVSSDAADQKKSGVAGTVRVSGAWALYPMMVKWGEEFRKVYPDVRIDVSAGGAGKGIADALAGMVDIGMVSRDIRPEELKPGSMYLPVVKDAVFPTINSSNPVAQKIIAEKGIKKGTFNDLWILEKHVTWGEIAGTTSKDRVQVYTRSDSCGAAETWANYLGKKQEDLMGVGVYGDPGLAEAVKRDVLGVGYNNLNYAYDAKTGVPVPGIQIIPIDVNENGKIDPAEDLRTKAKAIKAVTSGSYPSPPARDLYLITKASFKEPSKTFVKWILTDGQKYVDEVGYIKITPKQIKESLKKLEK
jgi:phosphate transport system substrate-binding protein